MELDGLRLLRALRGAAAGIVLMYTTVVARPTLIEVHATLLYASLCALIAGMQAAGRVAHRHTRAPVGVRVWQCVVCAALFSVCTMPGWPAAALYVAQVYPWMGLPPGAHAHADIAVQFASCVMWAELLVLGLAHVGAPVRAATAVACMLGSLLVSVTMLAAPEYIVPLALHPCFRALDALTAHVCASMRGAAHDSQRDFVILVSQTWCIVFVAVLAFSTIGVLPVREYVLALSGGTLVVSHVDVVLAAYTPLLLPCVFVLVSVARPVWKLTLSGLLMMDSMFVPMLMLGPTLCSWVLGLVPDGETALGSCLAALLAVASSLVVLFYVTVLIDEAYACTASALARALAQRGGYARHVAPADELLDAASGSAA